ncbi:hypothetical protein MSG28_016038 [Choristoneura fumiferana]|uniref:Uncharacterized protein n=1 Tax=Choristoneura fumiferana TaxID=7141 RepID=A0ACC0K5N1_CHOFU|nr:hypothetical protein MSG28_016038 [Choristoneura fumiferana]
MATAAVLLTVVLAVVSALPTQDPVIRKLDPGPRYQHVADGEGTLHLVDMWQKASDISELNPTVSQPMLLGNTGLLGLTNYDPRRRTIVLIHGWNSGTHSPFNTVLVPGEGIARFIDWLNGVTGAVATHYHIVGHSLGAHMAGIIGRNVNGNIAYLTGKLTAPSSIDNMNYDEQTNTW